MAAKRNRVTDGAASIIKLVRRKNRRASITEQFLLPAAKTKQREKVAQARHHAFLMQHDNASAIHELADRVRMITEMDAATLGHTLSPMDKHRFQVWSTELLAILTEFLPSETHENDPILQLLEKLQFLQEGHVCLAEVSIDGRQLIEKWERAGVFDDNGESSSDEDDEEGDEYNAPVVGLQVGNWAMDKRRKIEASYAYQCIRERAASRVIKRNTLKWVRSRVAFCSRVEEIQVFGNTTAALMEELTMMSPLQRRAAVSSAGNTSDIFDLMKGKSHVNGAFKINFTDLMHYSKHLALFTVDHALRRVEELQVKRRLYENRCAIKLQAWWRKMHEVVKGRRMLKLLAEVKRKQQQEQNEQRLREKAAKAPPAIKTDATVSSHKPPKTPVAKSSKAVRSTSTRSVSKGDGDASETASKAKSPRGAPGRDTKPAYTPTPPSTPKVSSKQQPTGMKRASMPHASRGEDKEEKAARAARAREAREARLRKAFEDELLKQKREDEEAAGDTQDVETAWKRFLQSAEDAQAEDDDAARDENADILDLDGSRASTANSGTSSSERGSRGATPYTNGAVDTEEWRSWSDSDDDHGLDTPASGSSNRNGTPRSTASSRLSTPQANATPSSHPADAKLAETKPMPPMKVVVTVKKGNRSPRRPPASKNQSPPSDGVETTEDDAGGRSGLATPGATPTTSHAPSRRHLLLMEATETRKRRPKAVAGAGRLSRMMPFADFGDIEPLPKSRSQLRSPQPSTRRHLFEMDFQQAVVDTDSGALDMFFLDQPLFPLAPEEATREPPRSIGTSASSASTASPTRVVRAARVAKTRAALQQKPAERPQQPVDKTPDLRDVSETPRTPPVVFKPTVNSTNARDRLVLRTANPSASDRESSQMTNPLLKFDFRKENLVRKTSQTAPAGAQSGSESPDTLMKSKFGSHAEWLESMGLGGAVAAASRSARSPRRPNGRNVKLNTDSEFREAKLVESIATVKQTAAQRERRKRTQAHALPLIGRRPVGIKPTEIQPATSPEAHDKEKLPQVELQKRKVERHSRHAQRSPRSRKRSSRRSESEQTNGGCMSSVRQEDSGDSASSGEEDEDSDSSESEAVATSSLCIEATPREEGEESSEFDATISSDENEEATEGDAPEGIVQRRKSSRRPRGSVRSPRRSCGKLHEPKHARDVKKAKKPRRWHRSPNNDSVDEDAISDDEDHGERRGSVRKGSSRFRPNVTSLLQRLVPKDKRWSFDAMRHSRDGDDDLEEVEDPLEMDIDEEGETNERQERDEGDSNSDADDSAQQADAVKAKAFEKLYTQYMGLLNAGPPLILRPQTADQERFTSR